MPSKPLRTSTRTLLVSASLLLATAVPLPPFFPAYGQGITTGTIVGITTDASEAVVPNATITAMRPEAGTKLTGTSDGKGEFSFRNVPAGNYVISIQASGFETLQVNASVAAGQTSDLGTSKLAVGSSAVEVKVSDSTADLFQTTQSQVSTTFTALQLEDLPLNGGLDNVALLTPGVAIGHDAAFSNSNGNNLSINGNRSRSNNYEIDGQSNNDNSVAGPQIFFANQDALESIQVITSNYSAQYGRNMGGVVNYLTKAGTNRLHGSGYEFYTGSWLQSFENGQKNSVLGYCAKNEDPADGCTVPVLPRYVDNRWGGTLGGPVWKDKVWFFGGTNFEHTRQGFTPLVTSTTTPTPTGLQELAAAFPGNPAVAGLTASGPYSLAGAKLAGATTIKQVVGPNGLSMPIEFGKVSTSVSPLYNDQEDLGRIDWQPDEKNHVFLRYIYQLNNSMGNQESDGYYYNVPDATHSIGGDWAHTFSSNWVNQLRYSFQQSKLFFQGGTQASCDSTSLDTCITSVGISGFVGYGYPDNIPQGRTVKVTQVQDNANWTHGGHSISFGGDFTFQNSPNTFLPYYNGGFTYTSFSNYIQDNGTLTLANGNPVIPFTEPDFGLYLQDDWKVSHSLTLNLGFRYEFFDQAVNKLHDETVARESGPGAFWDTSLPLSERTYPYTNRNWKNLQPRLGFAFNPESMHNLVIRGAYGIQYDPAFYNIFLNSATAAPVVNQGTVQCAGDCLPGADESGAAVRALNLPKLPTGVNPNTRNQTNNPSTFVNPRVQTYNLGFQYDLHRAVVGLTYVGNHVSRQFISVDANPYLLQVAQAFPNQVAPSSLCEDTTAIGYGRLNCGEGNVRTRNNNGFSNYNSLQVQLKTNAFHGLTGDVNYTYSRVIDNADEIFAAASSPAFAQNPLQTDIPERGVANYSYPNLASIGLNYVVPTYKTGNSLINRATSGFELSTVWAFNNGEPWTASQSYSATTFADPNSATNGAINTSSYCDPKFDPSFIGADACRPVVLNNGAPISSVGIYVVDPNHTFTTAGTGYYSYESTDANGNLNTPINKNDAHWLYNNKAYANLVGNPYPGSPRNINRGQSYNNVDFSVIKNTTIAEGVSIKLYLNALNVLNHPFLGTPDVSIEDAGSSFGTNTYNTGNQRTVQLGGKVVF